VLDAAGVPVAEVRSDPWLRRTIVTGDGTEIPVRSGPFLTRYGVKFGNFAEASATYLLQRGEGFKLKLSDELLARPDHEMLVAVFVHFGRVEIRQQRRSAKAKSHEWSSGAPTP
jgi:hypothetical protein